MYLFFIKDLKLKTSIIEYMNIGYYPLIIYICFYGGEWFEKIWSLGLPAFHWLDIKQAQQEHQNTRLHALAQHNTTL